MWRVLVFVAVALGIAGRAEAQQSPPVDAGLTIHIPQSGTPAREPSSSTDAAALAEKLQNPIADLINVPFQNNTNFNVGPHTGTQDVLNIQPVILAGSGLPGRHGQRAVQPGGRMDAVTA